MALKTGAMRKLCGNSATLWQRDHADRQRAQEDQQPLHHLRCFAGKSIEQAGGTLIKGHRWHEAPLVGPPEGGLDKLIPPPPRPALQGTDRDLQGRSLPLRGRLPVRHQDHRQGDINPPAQEPYGSGRTALPTPAATEAEACLQPGAKLAQAASWLTGIVGNMQDAVTSTALQAGLLGQFLVNTDQESKKLGILKQGVAHWGGLYFMVKKRLLRRELLIKLSEGGLPVDHRAS